MGKKGMCKQYHTFKTVWESQLIEYCDCHECGKHKIKRVETVKVSKTVIKRVKPNKKKKK